MKIRINLMGGGKNLSIDFEALKKDVYATAIWADMAKTKLGAGLELRRWSVRKAGGEKWDGLPSDQGPPLRDGDFLILRVELVRQQPQPSSG